MAKLPYAVFDIETVVDWKLVEAVEECSREEFLRNLRKRYPDESDPFVSYVFHLPVAIAIGFTDGLHLERVGSLAERTPEALARKFWEWAERYQTQGELHGVLVSYNGRGFDMPVLEQAALRYGIAIPWHCRDKGNRYRFQTNAHFDVMDYLAAHGGASRPKGGLSTESAMVGLPAKGLSGGDVQRLWEGGEFDRINAYCRNDCRRLFAVFNRVQYMRGLSPQIADPPELEPE